VLFPLFFSNLVAHPVGNESRNSLPADEYRWGVMQAQVFSPKVAI